MSQKGARKSQSAFFLSPAMAESGENSNNDARRMKRPREEIETPTVTLSDTSPTPSEITLVEPQANTSRQDEQPYELERNYAALKLERLNDKVDRYKSHEEFLRRCIDNQVTPLSYKVFLEPSIGNHDENFLKGYQQMLSEFSTRVMKYTADYCAEKIIAFDSEKEIAAKSLSDRTPDSEFKAIKSTLIKNQEKRIKTLKETKDRKFIRLKYPKDPRTSRPTQQDTFSEQDAQQHKTKPSYAQAVQRKRSQTRFGRDARRNVNQKILSRENSQTNVPSGNTRTPTPAANSENNVDEQINNLERQIITLRRTQRDNQRQPHSNSDTHATKRNFEPSKNGKPAPLAGGNMNSSHQNVNPKEIIDYISAAKQTLEGQKDYISTAMQTLTDFEKRLQTQLNTDPTHSEWS